MANRKHPTTSAARYTEIDLLRTFAIILMVIYHIAFDLQEWKGIDLHLWDSMAWFLVQRISCSLFLLLVGVSFAVSWHRTRSKTTGFPSAYRKYLARGVFLLAWGMVITLITRIAVPDDYIRYGILHLIGTSILLLPFFAILKEWALVPAMMCFVIGRMIRVILWQNPLLLPLGIRHYGFSSIDYFPLLPWLGVVLIGYAIGYHLYVRRQLQLNINAPMFRKLSFPGRHSLVIYLIHQPIILGMLWVV